MAEKLPARRAAPLPSVFSDLGSAAHLTVRDDILGFTSRRLARDGRAVGRSADYLDQRRRQSDAYTALIDARMRIARKLAELADLPHVIAEDQRVREHTRWQAETLRNAVRRDAEHEGQMAAVRRSAELAKIQEVAVRAQRNLEAALRVKDAQLDQWYCEAQARTNNAKAEFQDTATDLARDANAKTSANDAAQKVHDFALIDREIDLQRGRGNDAAVLALLNLKALLLGT